MSDTLPLHDTLELRKSHYVRKLRLLNCSWGETMFFDVIVGVLRLHPCSCYFITVLNYFLRLYLDSLNKRGLLNQPTRSRRSYRAWIRRRPNTCSRTRRGYRSLPSVYWTSFCHMTMTWSKENNMSCSPKICKEEKAISSEEKATILNITRYLTFLDAVA